MAKILRSWDDKPHRPEGSGSGGPNLEDAYAHYGRIKRQFEAQAYGVYRKAAEPTMDTAGQVHYPVGQYEIPEEVRAKYEKENPGMQAPTFMMVTAGCARDKHKPCKNICACGHVAQFESYRPKKIYFMPFGYYLCDRCYGLAERRRLDFGQCLVTCWTCVTDVITELKAKDPALFVDLCAGEKGMSL